MNVSACSIRCMLAALVAATTGFAAIDPSLPSVFIAGDSAAADGTSQAIGWGDKLAPFFDSQKVNLVNDARPEESSRTFVTRGAWERMLSDIKANDYVIIQFGRNDDSSLTGVGDETQEIDNQLTKRQETVHTFGWYLRNMIRETRDKHATPILFSPMVPNTWKGGRVERGAGQFREWIRELAETENVAYFDLTDLAADRYEQMGETALKAVSNDAGAELNARFVVAGLKAMRENAIIRALSAKGRRIETAPFQMVALPHLTRPPASAHEEFMRWLNLPDPADVSLPSLFLVGDSTVRNGRGDGIDGPGQWGWGDPLAAYFDSTKINVVNRAVGGTGVQTFMAQGYWDRVLTLLKPGDVVIMQFGHNDNGARAPLHGVGDETEVRQGANGGAETMHTWGWYLRKYISDARAKGAIPVVCTLIPRNTWENEKIARQRDSHADWARAVAASENAPLLDLNERIATSYDAMGEAVVTALFADKKVHTTREGAERNAGVVVSALKSLKTNPLDGYFRSAPAKVW
jgi:lysophospholipase L1-like esterase